MTYHRLQTKEGDRFYREAEAGHPIVLLHCSSGPSAAVLPGGRTRTPTRRVVEILRRALPYTQYHEIVDAGLMRPRTHPTEVAEAILNQVESINSQRRSAA